jgi:crotonobetainyl-CoA:carnitine CoA-transferase CaiB-like acyl-CoA transferase
MASSERAPAGGAQALQGLRVVEFTSGMAGPWIGRLMAYCGAEVIKIESQQRPSVVRLYVSPRAPELGVQAALSPWFTDWDAGKRFVALDLTRPEGVALARRIVAVSDVLVENYSSGVMEKLGLGYEDLERIRPDLVYFSSSGYGDTGPCRRYVSWGSNIEAMSGLATLSGFPERACTLTQFAYPDAQSALHGLFAVLCALDHRSRTGEGQRITLSQLEATVCVLGPLLMQQLARGEEPPRLGNASLSAAPQGCYPCRGEDRWCAITVEGDAAWQRFCEVVERPEWKEDPRFASLTARLGHRAELDAAISQWTRTRDAYEVMHTLQRAGIAAGVAQTAEDEFRHDAQLKAREFIEEVEHLAKGHVLAPGIPLGLTGTPGRTGRAGAAMGQDNDYVFGELLGMSPDEIRSAVLVGAIEPAATERAPAP